MGLCVRVEKVGQCPTSKSGTLVSVNPAQVFRKSWRPPSYCTVCRARSFVVNRRGLKFFGHSGGEKKILQNFLFGVFEKFLSLGQKNTKNRFSPQRLGLFPNFFFNELDRRIAHILMGLSQKSKYVAPSYSCVLCLRAQCSWPGYRICLKFSVSGRKPYCNNILKFELQRTFL